MSVDAILGQAGTTSTQASSKSNEEKNMFLQLLVAQLSNQDPLNPTEDTEFLAQLAQFTQVEELQKLNEGMTSMVEAYDREQFLNATSLLGTSVLAGGTTVSKITDEKTETYSTTAVYFTSEADMATCTVNVHAPGGYILYSKDYGSRQAGSYTFEWDGTGPAGMIMPDGVYEYSVSATDLDGNKIMVTQQVFGTVMQVERDTDGAYSLHMLDGRSVKLEDVTVTGYVINNGSGNEEENTENNNENNNNSNTETP